MTDDQAMKLQPLNPKEPSEVTESGELERPVVRRRRIDCGGNPEVSDRKNVRGTGRREADPIQR